MTLQTHEQIEHVRSLLSPQDVDLLFAAVGARSWAEVAYLCSDKKAGADTWSKIEAWCTEFKVKLLDYGT